MYYVNKADWKTEMAEEVFSVNGKNFDRDFSHVIE